jgi:phosphatidylserine decarboxylase
MLLTWYGLREWGIITIVAALAAAGAVLLNWWWALPVLIIIWLALVAFFRDPVRRIPANLRAGDMLSPADGKVTAVLEVDHHESTGGPARIIRIFLSVLNVHINRSPFDGEVKAIEHTPGKYLNAQKPESADVNESNLITMRIAGGESIGVRQVAGMIARRIVCRVAVGQRVVRGERIGMIKFGSTTELILPRPRDVVVHVREGEKVKAGKTVLATFPIVEERSPRRDTEGHGGQETV